MLLEQDSCQRFLSMIQQCSFGWMKVVVIAATQYGYSIRGIPLCDQRLLIRGTCYSAIPLVSTEGIHDVYIAEGSMNGERFAHFIEQCLLPMLQPFNGINSHSVVIMSIKVLLDS